MITTTPISSPTASFPCREQGFCLPAESRDAPTESRALLRDAAATLPVVTFVAVAPKQRSPKMSVSWLTFYVLVDRLPVSAGNFAWALQRYLSIDFQNQDVVGKIFSCSKQAC